MAKHFGRTFTLNEAPSGGFCASSDACCYSRIRRSTQKIKNKIVTGEHLNNVSVVRAVHGGTTDTVKLRPPAFSENPELSKIPSVEPKEKAQNMALHASMLP